MRLFSIILFLFMLLAGTSQAQTLRNFTAEPGKFAKEMQSFLEETDKREAGKLMEAFLPVWTSGAFTAAQQEAVYKTCNSMLRKRMKAFPDFRNYLQTLLSFASSGQSAASFQSWQTSMDKLLLLPSRYFSNYIHVCDLLFRDNTLYESASARWYSSTSNYSFEFDSLPRIVFPVSQLICSAKSDSSVIASTQGVYYPTRQTFYGKGGKVNWLRAGLDENTVRADLSEYQIDITGPDFFADSTVFYYPGFFKQPLVGRYTDKLLANVTEENATYPRFESYTTELQIRQIVPGVDYRGGFSLVGARIVGSGNKENLAEIFIDREGKPFFRAASSGFSIRKDRITSDQTTVCFTYSNDSLYHPSVSLKYMVDKKELTLIRAEEGKSKAPYLDSYHQIDLYFDGLYWKIDQPLIDMKMISAAEESKAIFESANFFRKNRFMQLQGISDEHPLYTLKKYGEAHGTREIYTEDLAREMRMQPSEIRSLFLSLSNYGFVAYDGKEDKAILKDRAYYYLQANVGKVDYDVLRLESTIKALPNASINLLNFELTLRGLAPIVLSDSQNVVIYPKEQEVKMGKNRNFTFAGRIRAGRFEFFGKQFGFEYQNFKLNLDNVDSLRLKVESDNPGEIDDYGNRKLVYVRSVIENINGDLLIDDPNNKSGRKEFPVYPIFNSKKDSYVYYERPWIQDGVYDRDLFYFHLDPFTIDSLDNFTRAGLSFGGEFVSASIFKEFRDSLKLQPDLSLGLVRETGPAGWLAYGGKGTFTNTLSLSNQGLYGDGTLDYLTSHSVSDAFLFLPDSMNSRVYAFTNRKMSREGVEFPGVKGDTVQVHWEPKHDFMLIQKVRKDLDMYEGQVAMTGSLTLSPPGMTGEGTMKFYSSELDSRHFRYKSNVFDADTSNFRLNSDETTALAFSTDNIRSHIDFTGRFGDFKSNTGGTFVKFPLNQYISYIDQFKWFMDQKELELSSSSTASTPNPAADTTITNITLSGSEFVSLEPRQDSLRFKAPFARYSLKDYLIKAEQVALIQTADAYVIPDSGKVVVERYAKIQTLNQARIIANTTTKYHTIYNAKVDVLGRKSYTASGDYDYVDEKSVKHHFHFDDIGVDTSYQTVASGELSEEAAFPLSSKFQFKGGVKLQASHQYMTFSGYTKPAIQCAKVSPQWIRFSADINPLNVLIPIKDPVTDAGVKLSAAIAQASDSTGIYAAFLMPKIKPGDLELVQAAGYLYFDKTAGQFKITTQERLEKPTDPGNFMSLDEKKCLVYGEGQLDFGSQLGQMELKTVGNVTKNLINDSTRLEVLAAIDFPFESDALKIMAEEFAQDPTLQPTVDVGRSTFERGVTELAGKAKAEKILAELNLYGSFKKIPEELRHTIFLSDLPLAWNNETKSYRSTGLIGVGSIEKISVNKKMKGYVEIVHKRTGDALNIYLEPAEGTWYYFSYARGMLQTLSTNSSYNEVINKIKPEKRVIKEKEKPDFEFMVTTERSVKNFLKKMQPQPPSEEEGK